MPAPCYSAFNAAPTGHQPPTTWVHGLPEPSANSSPHTWDLNGASTSPFHTFWYMYRCREGQNGCAVFWFLLLAPTKLYSLKFSLKNSIRSRIVTINKIKPYKCNVFEFPSRGGVWSFNIRLAHSHEFWDIESWTRNKRRNKREKRDR